jgi:threonine aldolase
MIDRLHEDHQKAKLLADGLSDISEITFPKGEPQTNMVFLKYISDDNSFASKLLRHFKSKGILFAFSDRNEIRLVTHYWISEQDIKKVIDEFHRYF